MAVDCLMAAHTRTSTNSRMKAARSPTRDLRTGRDHVGGLILSCSPTLSTMADEGSTECAVGALCRSRKDPLPHVRSSADP